MRAIGLCVVALLFVGCYKLGRRQVEDGVVQDVVFNPASSGTGITSSGHVAFVNTDAAYGVVLECQHGKFVVQGDGDDIKALWSKVHKGDHVKITYAEKIDGGRITGFKFYGAEVQK